MALRIAAEGVLALVETVYDGEAARDEWVARVNESVLDVLPEATNTSGFVFRSHRTGEGLEFDAMEAVTSAGEALLTDDAVDVHMHGLPPSLRLRMFGMTSARTLSEVLVASTPTAEPLFRETWKDPTADSVGLVGAEPDGTGFCIGAALPRVSPLEPRERALLEKLAMHIGAGLRLRRTSPPKPNDAEAILSPRGKLLHAKADAPHHRALLDDGLKRRTAARESRHDAERALEIWRGLVSGRWSLVDHFDTDGKRFVLAMENAPRVPPRAPLTPRERRVVALAAMGHRDKEIAYILGLSVSSVSSAIHRARKKLGVRTRAELVVAGGRG